MYMSVSNINCVVSQKKKIIIIVCITFYYNIIGLNYDACGCLWVLYKYNISLYNLIIRK